MPTTHDGLWALAPDLAEGVFSLYRKELPRAEEEMTVASPLMTVADAPDLAEEASAMTRMVKGVAVIAVNGPIDRSTQRSMYSGRVFAVGQDAIRIAVEQAIHNPLARAVLLSINSPGGVLSGTKELADYIAEAGTVKPLAAYVDGIAASGAYWLASATGRVLSPATGQVGSIGVIMQVAEYSGYYRKIGVSFEYISSGKYKAAVRGERPLTEDERAYLQERMAMLHALFRDDVSARMHIVAAPAQWAEAQILIAPQAASLGLVSAIVRDEEAAIQTMMEVSMPNLTREALSKDAPELVAALKQEGREEAQAEARSMAEAQIKEQLAAAGKSGSECALAAMRLVCKAKDVSAVEALLNKAMALALTPAQLAGMAELLPRAASGQESAESGQDSRSAILAALQAAHTPPVNADVAQQNNKSPLVADALCRARAARI